MRDRRSGGRNLARLGGEDQAFVGTGFDNAVQFAWRRFRCIGFNNQPVATASHGLGACITDGPFRRGKKIWRRYRGSCWKGNCEPQPLPDTGETPLDSQRQGQERSKAVRSEDSRVGKEGVSTCDAR